MRYNSSSCISLCCYHSKLGWFLDEKAAIKGGEIVPTASIVNIGVLFVFQSALFYLGLFVRGPFIYGPQEEENLVSTLSSASPLPSACCKKIKHKETLEFPNIILVIYLVMFS